MPKRPGSRPPTKWKREMLENVFKSFTTIRLPRWVGNVSWYICDALAEMIDPVRSKP